MTGLRLGLALALVPLALAVSGCDNEGPAEKAGKAADHAAESAGKAVGNAAAKAGDAAENAGDAVKKHTE
jgi:hypothetical protein